MRENNDWRRNSNGHCGGTHRNTYWQRKASISGGGLCAAMVRGIHLRKSREAGFRAAKCAESGALLAAVLQCAAMEGSEGKTGYAAVSGLCLRAYGSSRPFAGAA